MAHSPATLTQLALFGRFAWGIGGYLRHPRSRSDCDDGVRQQLRDRAENFLRLVAQGVFAVPRSPYRALFRHVGVAFDDVAELVRRRGLEEALATLWDAGVRLSHDEFKGRVPVRRGSLEIDVASRDFDNPLSIRHFWQETGASRSKGTRVYIDLDHFALEAAYDSLTLDAFDLRDRAYALWRPPPPRGAGIRGVFRAVKVGHPVVRWFSQVPPSWSVRTWKHKALTDFARLAGRLVGCPVPKPEHVPLSDARRIAAWLAQCRDAGTGAWLNTNVASGVRVCLAARDEGIDITGTVFRLGGEPLTEARARIFRDAGCRVFCNYAMGEMGLVGIGCADATAVDDQHLLTDKLAVIQRPRGGDPQAPVSVNNYTSLTASSPKLMLNVESDDYGVIERRACRCAIGALGLDWHMHTIRSYEKLTSEGMNFLGHDLMRLVDEVLPARFGGAPTDYQFVEEDEGGLPKVSLVVSPRVGPVDESAALDAVVGFLNRAPGATDDHGERWREARTLRVERREPYATAASKVLALHTLKLKDEVAARRRH